MVLVGNHGHNIAILHHQNPFIDKSRQHDIETLPILETMPQIKLVD